MSEVENLVTAAVLTIGGDSGLTICRREVSPGAAACEQSDSRNYYSPDASSQGPGKDLPAMQQAMRAYQFGKGFGPKRSTCGQGADESSLARRVAKAKCLRIIFIIKHNQASFSSGIGTSYPELYRTSRGETVRLGATPQR